MLKLFLLSTIMTVATKTHHKDVYLPRLGLVELM